MTDEPSAATEADPGSDTPASAAVAPKRSWVRMRTIFGESVMPPESAAVVMRAVNRAVAVGDVPRNARWQFVELLAADYLAGQYTERELLQMHENRAPDQQAG